MRMRACSPWIIAAVLLTSSSAWADQHVVAPSAMRQAIADRKASEASDRDAVLKALRHPDARDLAARLGLNLQRAEGAVKLMTGDQLAQLAKSARAADPDLAGGANTIVISTTTLLLVLILIVLLVN